MKTDGIVLVNKPKEWTSHDVVAKVRNNLKKRFGHNIKVGHTGTLDPSAEGLMILVIGKYTKKAEEFSKLPKKYYAVIKLGAKSSTGDSEGELEVVSERKPDKQEVFSVLKSFLGESMQTPPAFSAIKIGGKRAYKLARSGQQVELKQRQITIYDIEEIEYKYPYISFMVSVSSGTYIRSLAEDIGTKLSTGAYLWSLKRTEVGNFNLENANQIEDIKILPLETDAAN